MESVFIKKMEDDTVTRPVSHDSQRLRTSSVRTSPDTSDVTARKAPNKTPHSYSPAEDWREGKAALPEESQSSSKPTRRERVWEDSCLHTSSELIKNEATIVRKKVKTQL